MKKYLSIFVALILGLASAQARDVISRNVADLPASARTTLTKYFPKKSVNHIKIDKKLVGNTDYEVILNDGTEVDFDHNGNWKEIDMGSNAVPEALLPKALVNYVRKNYKGTKIIGVDKKNNKYEIELSNGLDLEFDRAGNFLRIDR